MLKLSVIILMKGRNHMDYSILLLPLVIYLGVVIPTLIHVSKQEIFRVGDKTFWIVVVAIFNLFGALAYFIIGRDNQ